MSRPYSFDHEMTRPFTHMSVSTPFEERIARFRKIIAESEHIVFFGGAGVSTGSGIPDFRSANGLYNNMPEEVRQYEPEYLLSRRILFEHADVFYKFYRNYMDLRSYEPNSVHRYLAELEKNGKMEAVVTQNVDLLHEKAGTKKLYKIHGTIERNHCDKCKKIFDRDYIFNSKDDIPRCDCHSRGLIRPDVVFYGESLPSDQWNASVEAIHNADCLIVCGTSLTVYPAASLVKKFRGRYLIVVNMSATPYDTNADVVFNEDMNSVFDRLSEN